VSTASGRAPVTSWAPLQLAIHLLCLLSPHVWGRAHSIVKWPCRFVCSYIIKDFTLTIAAKCKQSGGDALETCTAS
jgi:hypothetical protein